MAQQRGKEHESIKIARIGEGAERGMAPAPSGLPWFDWMADLMQRDFFSSAMFHRGGRERLARLDMEDTGQELVVTAELPGIDPADVHVERRGDTLVVRGERRRQETPDGPRSERHANFYREVRLPYDVDVDQAQASLKNGLLTIRFPRDAEEHVRRIDVNRGDGKRGAKAA